MEQDVGQNLDGLAVKEELLAGKTDDFDKKWKFLRIFLSFILGLLLILANFWWQQGLAGSTVSKPNDQFVGFNYIEENIIPEWGIVRFASEAEHGFKPRAEVLNTDDDAYIFALESGKFWANFQVSTAKVNFVFKNLVLIPNQAQFDLEFDGSRLDLAVYNGDVYLGFLPQDSSLKEYKNPYDSEFLNRFLVPRDSQVSINVIKLDQRLGKLLFSKLVKEFKHSAIPETERENSWIKENLLRDDQYLSVLKKELSSKIIRRGEQIVGGFVQDKVFLIKDLFTLVPEKRNQRMMDLAFAYLDDVIFHLSDNDTEGANEKFSQFQFLITKLDGANLNPLFQMKLKTYLDELAVFNLNDKEYAAMKMLLRANLFKNDLDNNFGLNTLWLDVYNGLDLSPGLSEAALNEFYQTFDDTLGAKDDGEEYRQYITYYNQLFDNLFLRYATFYQDGYFAIKEAVESELLGLYPIGQSKEEITQALISAKIDFLKRLRKFFFDDLVEVAEAKEIFERLVEEIDNLMLKNSSDTAVLELFEVELADVGDFWGYLISPEYHSSVIYGSSHQERYENYLKEREQIWSFIDVQSEVLGDESVPELSLDQARGELMATFTSDLGFEQIEAVDFDDVNQRLVKVAGSVGGYNFEANYDRYYLSLTDVYAYGELISERAVKLGSLLPLLQAEFSNASLGLTEDDSELVINEETNAERIARIYIQGLVEALGFSLEIDNVEVLDDKNTSYRISDIILPEYDYIKVTFDYLANLERVVNFYMIVEGEPIVIDGEFSLDEIVDLVLAEHERREAEKLAAEKAARDLESQADVNKINRLDLNDDGVPRKVQR